MATSSSTNYKVNRDQIIKGALRLVGALAQGESPTTDQTNEAAEALNLMIKTMQTYGMPLWALKETQITLTASTSTYRIGEGQTINTPKPLKVIQAWRRETSSSVDTPMRIITKDEYNRLGNKTSSGAPIQCYYDPQNTYGDLHVFPTPSSTDASLYSVFIVYQRPFEDFDASTDDPDFPQEWHEVLKYQLAVRLSKEYGVTAEEKDDLRKDADRILSEALSFGSEEGSVYMQYDWRGY